MPSEEWQLAELPGPRRFFARISQAVDTGRNVIVVLPRSALSSTLAGEIREGIQRARCVHAYLSDATLEHCSGSIPEAAARTLDFINTLDDSQHHNRWLSYLNHPESGGKTVLIARW